MSVGLAVTLHDGEGLGVGDGVGVGEGDDEGVVDGVGDGVGDGEGLVEGLGCPVTHAVPCKLHIVPAEHLSSGQ